MRPSFAHIDPASCAALWSATLIKALEDATRPIRSHMKSTDQQDAREWLVTEEAEGAAAAAGMCPHQFRRAMADLAENGWVLDTRRSKAA